MTLDPRRNLSFDRLSRRELMKFAGGAGLAAAGIVALGLDGRGALAQDASPVAGGPPPLPPGAKVVASGLVNPRYLAIADDGTLYVSEAGEGGTEPIFAPPSGTPEATGGTPAAQQPIGTRGFTGKVSAITADGTVKTVAQGLPSYNVEGPVGPAGIVLANGKIWLVTGGAGPGTAAMTLLPNESSVLSIDPADGSVKQVANIAKFQIDNNPQASVPHPIDSDPYGAALGKDGKLYVADAGGNTLLRVDPTSGAIELVALIPGIPYPSSLKDAPGNEERGGKKELDPVPTGVAVAPDGTIYLGLLSGGPFPPGAAKVLKVGSDGSLTDYATGLTMVVGVAVGPDGNVYASQISTNFGGQQPAPGNVLRIKSDGTTESVVEGLVLPNGIAFDKDGNLFVAAMTVGFGPPGSPPQGMVLRFDGVAKKA
jgi:sugar lactone lactonase YvrE